MKSEIQEVLVVRMINYPCLMTHRETKAVFLFEQVGKGTVVYKPKVPSSYYRVGQTYSDFSMCDFKLFKGTITLTDDVGEYDE